MVVARENAIPKSWILTRLGQLWCGLSSAACFTAPNSARPEAPCFWDVWEWVPKGRDPA